MKKNKIFTTNYMKTLKQTSLAGCDPYSLKKLVMLLAIRCQGLEVEFRNLENEIRTQKKAAKV
jgi:hypothetical protein